MRRLAIVLCSVLPAGVPPAQGAGPEPLAKAVGGPAGDCSPGAAVKVPLITWGGDIPTIYANGSQAATAAGSLFAREGLSLKLAREDVFSKQLEAYLKCESPYLRGTAGMIAMASEAANRDPRTKPVAIYQLTWS
ncbi:MAG: nitrate ABC transporter substrate-binding protein, partial [Elusimicrobia bacterium]|nr:nitrate ABC transporter substrate-binding protein [Elusimicrobiota bacterium]